MSKPFAAFDIDGTVIRWQLYHGIVNECAKRGQLGDNAFALIQAARLEWKKRSNIAAFKDYERAIVQMYDDAVIHLNYDDYLRVVQQVFEEHKDQTYTYTRNLIHDLKAQGYLLFAISASQVEAVKLFADYYGFDDYGGSVYETIDGKFTGEKNILKSQRKPDKLRELVEKHQATFEHSIAIGDSESDIPMLSVVDKPLAFNPTAQLFEHAKAQSWKIVVERKNVIYNLEHNDGKYFLV